MPIKAYQLHAYRDEILRGLATPIIPLRAAGVVDAAAADVTFARALRHAA